MDFTQKELITLSNGLLALIKNAGTAKELTYSKETHTAIDDEIRQFIDLNTKICDMMTE